MELDYSGAMHRPKGIVNARVREVAESICYFATLEPFDIGGGCYVPAWAMFISEAVNLIKEAERIAKVKIAKK